MAFLMFLLGAMGTRQFCEFVPFLGMVSEYVTLWKGCLLVTSKHRGIQVGSRLESPGICPLNPLTKYLWTLKP